MRQFISLLLALCLLCSLCTAFAEGWTCASCGKAASASNLFTPCDNCGGTGKCPTCGGSGRVTKWVGDQYMTVDCSAFYCLGGTCSACSGSGHK